MNTYIDALTTAMHRAATIVLIHTHIIYTLYGLIIFRNYNVFNSVNTKTQLDIIRKIGAKGSCKLQRGRGVNEKESYIKREK